MTALFQSNAVDETSRLRDVVILGAGFSYAVCRLPLGNLLGQMALDRAFQSAPELFRSSITFSDDYPFEVWLSQLAADQPHLGPIDNGLNAVRFASVRAALVAALREVEAQALVRQPPEWFYRLLTVWHLKQSTLVSFNYDTSSRPVWLQSASNRQSCLHRISLRSTA